jgi:pimeloyl-ACP methyl ester carboxylesterase
MTYTSYRDSAAGEEEFLDAERIDSRLRRLGVPALVVFGEQDRFFRARDSAREFESLPRARIEVFEGVGHSPNVEAPERLASLVRELEASVSAPAG